MRPSNKREFGREKFRLGLGKATVLAKSDVAPISATSSEWCAFSFFSPIAYADRMRHRGSFLLDKSGKNLTRIAEVEWLSLKPLFEGIQSRQLAFLNLLTKFPPRLADVWLLFS